MNATRPSLLAALSVTATLALAYIPDSGRGFLKDDFRWLVESRLSNLGDLGRLLLSDNGFYRPLVSLSFTLNEALFGTWARGYALMNVGIVFLCCGALFVLGRSLGMQSGTALLAVGLWGLNPHGISGLMMWISGRTSGLVTLFSLLAAIALVRGRRWLSAALCFMALLSKEEALLLPFVLTSWAGWATDSRHWDWRRALRGGGPSLFTLVPYFTLRSQTDAFLPTSAPAYYRFTLDPAAIGRNVLEYADRSATLTAVVLLLFVIVVRRVRRLDGQEHRWIVRGLTWVVGGFGPSLLVPMRSSLYVCLPSVGVALVGATVGGMVWSQATRSTRARLAMLAILIMPLAMVPLLHARNRRMRLAADLSSAAVSQLAHSIRAMGERGLIVIEDDPNARPNLREVFGTLLEQAVMLHAGRAARVGYRPSGPDWTEASVEFGGDRQAPNARRLRLQHGEIVVVN